MNRTARLILILTPILAFVMWRGWAEPAPVPDREPELDPVEHGVLEFGGRDGSELDSEGMPLPMGAHARLGSARWFHTRPDVSRIVWFDDGAHVAVWGAGAMTVFDVRDGRRVQGMSPPYTDSGPDRPELADGRFGVDRNGERCVPVAFSADGSLAAMRAGNIINIHAVVDGRRIAQCRLPPYTFNDPSVFFSPDGRRVGATHSSKALMPQGINIFDSATGKLIAEIDGPTLPGAAFSPDGRFVAAGESGGQIGLWDAGSGKRLTPAGPTATVVALTRDGSRVALAYCNVNDRTTVSVWDTHSGTRIRTLEPATGRILDMSWSGDGKVLAAVDCIIPPGVGFRGKVIRNGWFEGQEVHLEENFRVILRDGEGRACRLPGVTSVSLSSDGSRYATRDRAGNVVVRRTVDGERLHRFESQGQGRVRFRSDSTVDFDEGGLRTADLATGSVSAPVAADADLRVGLSDDIRVDGGRLVLGWSDIDQLTLFDAALRPKLRLPLQGYGDGWFTTSFDISCDGRIIVTAAAEGAIVWRVPEHVLRTR